MIMKTYRNLKLTPLVLCLLALLFAAGCASTKVTNRQQFVIGQLPRPGTILVYDFAATPTDIPAYSALFGQPDLYSTPQTAQQIADGRRLGNQIAVQLVEQIRAMGMWAVPASMGFQPRVNDIVIRGYLVSINEGSAVKRVAIGFGSGASQMETAVEGFQMTPRGLIRIGSGTVNAGGNKTPGAALGVAAFVATANPAGLIISSGMKVYGEASGNSKVEGRAKATAKEIASVLKKRFQEQGWIH